MADDCLPIVAVVSLISWSTPFRGLDCATYKINVERVRLDSIFYMAVCFILNNIKQVPAE